MKIPGFFWGHYVTSKTMSLYVINYSAFNQIIFMIQILLKKKPGRNNCFSTRSSDWTSTTNIEFTHRKHDLDIVHRNSFIFTSLFLFLYLDRSSKITFFMNNKMPNSLNRSVTRVPIACLLQVKVRWPRSHDRCSRRSLITFSGRSLVHTTSALNGL